MKIEQLYTGCLAGAAYYIESEGEAAIIDPLRETTPYIAKAEKNKVQIKFVLETHFHADFVSGHIDLAKKTGAKIIFGPTAQPNYEVLIAKDNEEFKIGKLRIKAIHTPGHTPESTCYLLYDENGKEYCLFTGDTLFIGDVGRPDLALKGNLTERDLAGMLFDSLHNKIMKLPDEIIIYPGHGAGSACGKNMSKETFDTLGNQKKFNYALRAKDKNEFIKEVTTGLSKPPQYFPKNAVLNKMGYESIDDVMVRGTKKLTPDEFEQAVEEHHALILDVRNPAVFSSVFIPNSINIGIDGQFAPWVGALVTDLKQPIAIIADNGREEEAVLRLARVGYDNCIGYLEGGIESWINAGKQTDAIMQIEANLFVDLFHSKTLQVLDVRKNSEYISEHIKGVENFPLDNINDNMGYIDRHKTYYIHCAGGYRSMIAASILKARGFSNVIDIAGGLKAIKDTGKAKLTDYVCPSS